MFWVSTFCCFRNFIGLCFVVHKLSPPTLWLCQSLAISEYLHERRQCKVVASIERNWKSTSIHSCFESCDRLRLWNRQSFHEFLAIQTIIIFYKKIKQKHISLFQTFLKLPLQIWNIFEFSLVVLRALGCELQCVLVPEE